MRKIILDTNILLRHPRVLGLEIPGTEFLIPLDIIEELNIRSQNRGVSFDRRIDLIERASLQGTISIINADAPAFQRYREILETTKLTRADISIIAIALNLKNKGEDVYIATQDKDIWKVAENHKIGILTEVGKNDLFSKFIEPKTESNTVQTEIISYENKERLSFWTGIFIGVVATVIAAFIYKNIDKIVSTINIWGTITVILLAGITLFVFREKKRLSYGVFEFLIGVVAIIALFSPNGFNLTTMEFNLDFNIKLVGGLYIMVRGQDNIVKSQKDKKIGLWLKDKYGIGL
jgi:rRNA maturation endonuclease Nob1